MGNLRTKSLVGVFIKRYQVCKWLIVHPDLSLGPIYAAFDTPMTALKLFGPVVFALLPDLSPGCPVVLVVVPAFTFFGQCFS